MHLARTQPMVERTKFRMDAGWCFETEVVTLRIRPVRLGGRTRRRGRNMMTPTIILGGGSLLIGFQKGRVSLGGNF